MPEVGIVRIGAVAGHSLEKIKTEIVRIGDKSRHAVDHCQLAVSRRRHHFIVERVTNIDIVARKDER